jgi:hypothetical protein
LLLGPGLHHGDDRKEPFLDQQVDAVQRCVESARAAQRVVDLRRGAIDADAQLERVAAPIRDASQLADVLFWKTVPFVSTDAGP